MFRPSLRLTVVAAVLSASCARSPRPGGPEGPAPAREAAHPADEASAALGALLAAPPPAPLASDPDGAALWKGVKRFYDETGRRLAWFDGGEPRPVARKLREAVSHAADEGLDPKVYDVTFVDHLRPRGGWNPLERHDVDPRAAASADVRLTAAFLEYATHLVRGRVKPGQVDPHWFGTQRGDDVVEVLRAALASGDVEGALRGLLPQHPQYAALKAALARYRAVAARGGWPTLPDRVLLRPGRPDPAVATLQARLAATGDLDEAPAPRTAAAAASPAVPAAAGASPSPATPPAAPVFDRATQDALKRFQRRHGLAATGRLDPATRAALDVPADERVRQIELNLERWRWLPQAFGDRSIVVNVPTFHLTAFDHGRPALDMRIVAGKQDSPTPIFSDEMTTVVFSPYWNVPPEIMRKETIPALLDDPGYLDRNGLEVVKGSRVIDPGSVDWSNPGPVQIRQRPGAKNALGGVKFLFPNQYDVYLHDTPADALFANVERDYSHGCVRVEKPFDLAEWVLQGQAEWTPERIRAAMDAGREQQVALKRKIPVFILYETVWADDDGTVEFREDVYGHDARQEKMLPPGPPAQG